MDATQTTKHAVISSRILAELGKGKSVREAVEAVLGAGTYAAIADDIWEAFRRRAQS